MKKLILFSLLISGFINGASIYNRIRDGYFLKSDFSSVENLINQKNAFFSGDRFGYLQQAYGFYRYGLPIYELEGKFYEFCPRSYLSSLIFLPFMFINKNYFELMFVIFNFLLFAVLISILLYRINPQYQFLNYILSFIAICYELSSSSRILLETTIANLYLLTFVFLFEYLKQKKHYFLFLSVFSLSFCAGIRNENLIFVFLLLLFTVRNLKNLAISLVITSPFLVLISIKMLRCGDTSNFWGANFAGVKIYYYKINDKNANPDIWSEVIEEVNKEIKPPIGGEKTLIMLDLKPYYTFMRDYERKRIIEMLKEKKEIILIGLFKFLFYNPGAILFTQPYEIEETFNSLKFYNKQILFFLFFIYNVLVIISLIHILSSFNKIEMFYKFIFLFYLILLFVYSFFTMFGEHDWTRYRNIFIPLEGPIIIKMLCSIGNNKRLSTAQNPPIGDL